MIHNMVGPPVRHENFFGRDAFVRQISDKLREGNHILLAAPRRFGKTSVMYRLIDQPLWNYHVVHVDLEGLDNPLDLVARLLESTARVSTLAKLVSGIGALAETLVRLVHDNAEEIEIFNVRVKLRESIGEDWRGQLDALMRCISSTDQPVIFFLDELPMLLDHLCKNKEKGKAEAIALMRWLRQLRQDPDMHSLRFVLAGSIGIERILNEIGEISAINDFERMKLQPFTRAVADQFLENLSNSYNFPLNNNTRSAMIDSIGPPIPYFLQVLFGQIRIACEEQTLKPSPTLVKQIYHERVLGEDCKTYFDHYYSRFRVHYDIHLEKAAKSILRELAEVGEMTRDACYQFYLQETGDKADFDEFAGLMADLEYEFYVTFDQDQRYYRFACKLLRDWWLRHYGL